MSKSSSSNHHNCSQLRQIAHPHPNANNHARLKVSEDQTIFLMRTMIFNKIRKDLILSDSRRNKELKRHMRKNVPMLRPSWKALDEQTRDEKDEKFHAEARFNSEYSHDDISFRHNDSQIRSNISTTKVVGIILVQIIIFQYAFGVEYIIISTIYLACNFGHGLSFESSLCINHHTRCDS